MKEIEVKLGAGFPYGMGQSRFEIRVQDASSGVGIVTISLELEKVGELLSCLQGISGKAQVFDTFGILGKCRESKEIRVPMMVERPYGKQDPAPWLESIARFAEEHEVDGWKARIPRPDSLSRNQVSTEADGSKTILVNFVRFVDEEEQPSGGQQ